MRAGILAFVCAVSLAFAGCNSDRHRDESVARQAGREAYKARKQAKKAAKEIGRELRDAGREAREGWNEAKKREESTRRK